jgi:SSS family solute:Na+ symporter
MFGALDYFVFIAYFAIVISIGYWVSRPKEGKEKTSEDYFLAGRSLTWWAIGSSLIASNISAEQIVGMAGSGYAVGLAISAYEWMAAITLLIVGKWFLPIFLEKRIFTMPQFLAIRFDNRVSLLLAIFWVLLYVFVNLTSVLYLGATSLQVILGVPLFAAIVALAIFSALFAIYGGLTAVAWTDVIQVTVLVLGGLVITVLGLQAVGGGDLFAGITELLTDAPEKFNAVLPANHPEVPWIGVFLGGMWIANLSYWGCNQYITQRALAAKDLPEAQRGVLFAAFMKVLTPFVIVIPGILAFTLYANQIPADQPDRAYATIVGNLVPVGLTGLVIAGLTAAIVSSLNSMVNSASTIFTMDIVRTFAGRNLSERQLVRIGRIASAVALIIACLLAPQLQRYGQVFQFIQEYTGFVSPGIVVIFLFGLFWKRATTTSALTAAVLTIPVSMLMKFALPEMAFLNRMGIIFLVLAAVVVVITLFQQKSNSPKAIQIDANLFKTDTIYLAGSVAILGIVAAIYLFFSPLNGVIPPA